MVFACVHIYIWFFRKLLSVYTLCPIWGKLKYNLAVYRRYMQPREGRSRLYMVSYKLGGPPHPVIVTIRDNRDYIRVLLYSYYTTVTGWGVLLTYRSDIYFGCRVVSSATAVLLYM